MKLFPGLRAIALLRRIAKALEASNELARQRMDADYPYVRSQKPKGSKLRQAEITRPTTDEWNASWRERHGG